ncbi:MAG: NTP transferase domain-containing protein [Cytophagaceae bacterium]|nr:NTP transferase domain-containing protein [Cytophagaceae bacterium]
MSRLLILAGGLSSRMKKSLDVGSTLDASLLQQANTLPKGMIGVGENGRPFMEYLLYNASKAGFRDVILLLNPRDTVTQAHFEKKSATGETWGLRFLYARQQIPPDREKPLGTADAVQQALDQHPSWKVGTFVVCNSDNLYSANVFKLLLDTPHPNALPAYDRSGMELPEDRIKTFALLRTDNEGFLQDIIEKPTEEEEREIRRVSGSLGISMNIFKFDAAFAYLYFVTESLHPVRNEKELPGVARTIARQYPKAIYTIPVSETMPDLTSKADILIVQDYLLREFPEL